LTVVVVVAAVVVVVCVPSVTSASLSFTSKTISRLLNED